MPLRLLVPMEAAPGKRDELIKAFRIRSREVRQENGCEEFELYQSTERPDQMMLIERWTDETALETHAEVNRQKGNQLASLRTGTSKIERYIAQA